MGKDRTSGAEGWTTRAGSTLRELWLDLRESAFGFKRVYGHTLVPVSDMDRAAEWYCSLFGINRIGEDVGTREVHLGWDSGDNTSYALVTLVQAKSRMSKGHPILFTKRLKKVYNDCVSKGVRVWTIQRDSGGNHFFELEDSEGNRIEICMEPRHQLR